LFIARRGEREKERIAKQATIGGKNRRTEKVIPPGDQSARAQQTARGTFELIGMESLDAIAATALKKPILKKKEDRATTNGEKLNKKMEVA